LKKAGPKKKQKKQKGMYDKTEESPSKEPTAFAPTKEVEKRGHERKERKSIDRGACKIQLENLEFKGAGRRGEERGRHRAEGGKKEEDRESLRSTKNKKKKTDAGSKRRQVKEKRK